MENHMLARPERFFEDRFGLTSSALERLLGSHLAGRVDHADLYLEYRISEELTPEEGAVKKASRPVGGGRPHALYTLAEPPVPAALDGKLALLGQVDAAARAMDPRVKQVIASLGSEDVIVLIATPSGWTIGDKRPLTRLNVTVIVEENGKREIGSYGGGGRVPLDFFLEGERWRRFTSEAVRQATVKLRAVEAPAGEMTVVLGPGWPGILLHEAVGHGLEGDFNRKQT